MISNILIVEDDIDLSKGISLALKDINYNILTAYTISEARDKIKSNEFNLVILDLNLPDGNGLELLSKIRETSSVPVIILTVKDMEIDIVTGLELGADDYITKPFSLMVLRARVNAQLRKANGMQREIKIDRFLFNFEQMQFKKDNAMIDLSKTEQRLLYLLISNSGNTISRNTLIDKIWTDGSDYVDETALTVTIKRLRDKLEEKPSSPKYIKTVYGIGYKWEAN